MWQLPLELWPWEWQRNASPLPICCQLYPSIYYMYICGTCSKVRAESISYLERWKVWWKALIGKLVYIAKYYYIQACNNLSNKRRKLPTISALAKERKRKILFYKKNMLERNRSEKIKDGEIGWGKKEMSSLGCGKILSWGSHISYEPLPPPYFN